MRITGTTLEIYGFVSVDNLVDNIFINMKFIITENQYNLLSETVSDKKRSIINKLFDMGRSIYEIKTYTGFKFKDVIEVMKDKDIITNEDRCEQIHDYLYDMLWIDWIQKDVVFDDGSSIEIYLDKYSGSLTFVYQITDRKRIEGYATFLWSGDCDLPIDIEFVNTGDGDEAYSWYTNGVKYLNSSKFKSIKSLSDIINYFNNDFYKILKSVLDDFVLSSGLFKN